MTVHLITSPTAFEHWHSVEAPSCVITTYYQPHVCPALRITIDGCHSRAGKLSVDTHSDDIVMAFYLSIFQLQRLCADDNVHLQIFCE